MNNQDSTYEHEVESVVISRAPYAQLENELSAMHVTAMTNRDLAENLLDRLAASAAREGILRDTIQLNQDYLKYLTDSTTTLDGMTDVMSANAASLSLPDDNTALQLVIMNSDPIEKIRKFNTLAGNTDDAFNVRQAAMYFGLQCEELAEKLGHLSVTDNLGHLAHAIDSVGDEFKQGKYDHAFESADPADLLDDDVDQFVVTVGSMLSQGVDIAGAIAEVNRANMAKVWPDGTMHRDANGKIVKPGDWTAPDLSPFVCNRNKES